jgi:fatty acid desaturase
MSQMTILWAAIGLSALGTVLMWFGMFYVDFLIYVGLVVFAVGMLLGPLTHFFGDEEEEKEKNGDE